MTKFLYVYRGGKMGSNPAEIEATMKLWSDWFDQIGQGVIDGGAPFAGIASVTAEKAVDGASDPLSGYSLVNADDMEQAKTWAQNCPIVKSGGAIEIYETAPMSGM